MLIIYVLKQKINMDIIKIILGYDYYLELKITKVITNVEVDQIHDIGENKFVYDGLENQIYISDTDPKNDSKLKLDSSRKESPLIYTFLKTLMINSYDHDDNNLLEIYHPPNKNIKYLIESKDPILVIIKLPNLDYCFGLKSGNIQIWCEEENSFNLKYTLNGHTGGVYALLTTPPDMLGLYYLISLSDDKKIIIWNMKTKKIKFILTDKLIEIDEERGKIKLLGNNKLIYISDTFLIIWDYTTGIKLHSLELIDIINIEVINDKILLITNYNLCILNDDLDIITTLKYRDVRNISILPNHDIIMSNYSGLISIINQKTFQIERKFQTHGNIFDIVILSNGSCLLNKQTHIEILE